MTKQYWETRLEEERLNAKGKIRSLMISLEYALQQLDAGKTVNSSGVVQNSASQIDIACGNYMLLKEIVESF